VENEIIKIQNLENNTYVLRNENNESVLYSSYSSDSNKGHEMLCIISGVSFAIIWRNSSVYLFDPHSRSNYGQIIQNGKSVLLEFSTFRDVESYIREMG